MLDCYEVNKICDMLNDAADFRPEFRELADYAISTICMLFDRCVQALMAMDDAGWHDAAQEVPADPDELVLVQCSGVADRDRYDNGFAIATYDGGWIIEDVAGGERLTVEAWRNLPDIWEGDYGATD